MLDDIYSEYNFLKYGVLHRKYQGVLTATFPHAPDTLHLAKTSADIEKIAQAAGRPVLVRMIDAIKTGGAAGDVERLYSPLVQQNENEGQPYGWLPAVCPSSRYILSDKLVRFMHALSGAPADMQPSWSLELIAGYSTHYESVAELRGLATILPGIDITMDFNESRYSTLRMRLNDIAMRSPHADFASPA